MKILSSIIALLSIVYVHAQNIEQSKSLLSVDPNASLQTNKYSLSSGKLSPNNNFSMEAERKKIEAERRPQNFDMTGNNGLLKADYHQKTTPKWFSKDNEIKDEYKSDQYLGDFKSSGGFVQLVYRDHQSVDGDLVRIFVNDDVVRARVFLGAQFQGFNIKLLKGFNKIDIQALNQGTSGPNTAEFKLYDDTGTLITANEWNLTTGTKATMIVVKD